MQLLTLSQPSPDRVTPPPPPHSPEGWPSDGTPLGRPVDTDRGQPARAFNLFSVLFLHSFCAMSAAVISPFFEVRNDKKSPRPCLGAVWHLKNGHLCLAWERGGATNSENWPLSSAASDRFFRPTRPVTSENQTAGDNQRCFPLMFSLSFRPMLSSSV